MLTYTVMAEKKAQETMKQTQMPVSENQLSVVLKDSVEWADLIVRGMLFLSFGANTENTRSTLRLWVGDRSIWSADRRDLEDKCGCRNELNLPNRRILKLILNLTDNQWREAKTGVIWSVFWVPVRSWSSSILNKLETGQGGLTETSAKGELQ